VTSFPHGAKAIIKSLATAENGGHAAKIDGGAGWHRAGHSFPR